MFQHTATRRWLPAYMGNHSSSKVVSTHSHPKVAALSTDTGEITVSVSTHSHPKVAAVKVLDLMTLTEFQHTATRRWLRFNLDVYRRQGDVSTHSHPKVAANADKAAWKSSYRFNTQPPEGGCIGTRPTSAVIATVSTHSHPKVAAISPTRG